MSAENAQLDAHLSVVPAKEHAVSGIRHTFRVYSLAVPVTSIGLAILTLPSAATVRWVGGALLRHGIDQGERWNGALDFAEWQPEIRSSLRLQEPVIVFVGLRNFLLAMIVMGAYYCMVQHVKGKLGQTGNSHLLRNCTACMGLVGFIGHFGLEVACLQGYIPIPPEFMTLARILACVIAWVPGFLTSSLIVFSAQNRLKVLITMSCLFCLLSFAYNGWQFWSRTYFRIEGFWFRVIGGIMVPYVFGYGWFECVFWFACRSIDPSSLESAALYLSVPVIFTVSMATATQLGSVDLFSGICIEVGAALLELCFKHSLLTGKTLPQRWAESAGTAARRRCSARRSRTRPEPDESSPPCGGIVPSGGRKAAYAAQQPDVVDRARAAPEVARKKLLTIVALYSNLTEVIVQTIVAGFYIFGRVNPNETNAPPMPHEQVFTLWLLKTALEVPMDVLLAVMAARLHSGEISSDPLADVWNSISKESQLMIGALSALMAVESMCGNLSRLCPYSDASGEFLSVALCT
mmetsp:Transcript_123360/g.356556  ORF Transcript_123360/g.356556 Transcript_123360/m.356556 type:complete len:520 (+) Transcript_123360:75-1634(+)